MTDLIMKWLVEQPHWGWLSLGFLLATAEIVAPGFSLIWLGAAAVLTGLVAAFLPLPFLGQGVLFALLSLTLIYVARDWMKRHPIRTSNAHLNQPNHRMIGKKGIVSEEIGPTGGRVQIGDSHWPARGRPLTLGTAVKVIAVEGSDLLVEPLNA